jgi:ADP-ribose pyrophosphatase YjhB (NUDIX family)
MDKSAGQRLAEIADELRAIAANGLHWAANEYDEARYHRVMSLSAEIMGMADTRSVEEIERVFRGDLRVRTPFVGAEAAIFDEDGRVLLIRRKDNERWAMPGGAADVGESPSAAVVREVQEETGLRVHPERLVGIFDNRQIWSPEAVHIYNLTIICRRVGGVLTLTGETTDFGYFTQEEALHLPLHHAHGYRLTEAFRAYRGEVTECIFQ